MIDLPCCGFRPVALIDVVVGTSGQQPENVASPAAVAVVAVVAAGQLRFGYYNKSFQSI